MQARSNITSFNESINHASGAARAPEAARPARAARAEGTRRGDPPNLSVDQVLYWVDAFFERTGVWPDWQSGPIDDSPVETWFTVAEAMALGRRGFSRGQSLREFIEQHRGGGKKVQPVFSERQILAWALDWRSRTGRRPRINSGKIPGSGGVTWRTVNDALEKGLGILPGGSSLGDFLRQKRRVLRGPAVTEKQILFWADAYYRRTQRWPTVRSGAIPEAPGENWSLLDRALVAGTRSLPGGSSLGRLLATERGVEAQRGRRVRPLYLDQILYWAKAHRDRTGHWPTDRSGPIPETENETWRRVQRALRGGGRGLPGGSSLFRFLPDDRGQLPRKYERNRKPFSTKEIVAWAEAHRSRTGRWPTARSGKISESVGDTWHGVHHAVKKGGRGFPGGSSLVRLFGDNRPKRWPQRSRDKARFDCAGPNSAG